MSLVRISELLSSRLALASLASIVVSSALVLRGRARSAQKACSTQNGTQAVINLLHTTFDRLQFEIDIGLPEEAVPGEAHDLCASTFHKPLMEVINAISDITGGLSYQYAKGTWTADDDGKVVHEMDATLNLRVIVLPEEHEEIFDKIKQVISQAVKENQLPCNWIQVCETPLKQRFFEANPGKSWTQLIEHDRRPADIQRTKKTLATAVQATVAANKLLGTTKGTTRKPAKESTSEDCPTFKDFIRPAAHVEDIAQALKASPIQTIGKEQTQSGPHGLAHANATLISCCGSFVHQMAEFGYVPLAAPVLDFSSLAGSDIVPSDACLSSPRSFSLFVALKGSTSVSCLQDIIQRKFKHVAINDCAASGAGALVAFAKQRNVPWKGAFYSGGGSSDGDITCPRFVRPTGSHFESLNAVLQGKVDVALVDIIVLMHFKATHPEDFTALNVVSPPIGDFLYYPIFIAKTHETQKHEFLTRLNQMPVAVLKPMFIKKFKPIEVADFAGNPPIITD